MGGLNVADQLLRRRLNPAHVLLLGTCLWEQEKAVRAWKMWRAEHEIEKVDAASARLLPLLYKRLLDFQIHDAKLDRLKGAYRYTWVNNIKRLKHAEDVARSLGSVGITPVFLKGVPMLLKTYQDFGVRFINDIDILVGVDEAEAAFEALKATGYQSSSSAQRVRIQYDYAIPLVAEDKAVVDIHWHLLSIARETDIDQYFTEHAIELQLGTTPIRALDDTEQLLVACVQMLLDSVERQVRYMADAYKLVESGAVNWKRLVQTAFRCRIAHFVCPALRLIRVTLMVPVPLEVLDELDRAPRNILARIEPRVQLSAPTAAVRLARRWCLYKRSTHPGFLRYLRECYEVQSSTALATDLFRRLRRAE